jgi:hypothetical protein
MAELGGAEWLGVEPLGCPVERKDALTVEVSIAARTAPEVRARERGVLCEPDRVRPAHTRASHPNGNQPRQASPDPSRGGELAARVGGVARRVRCGDAARSHRRALRLADSLPLGAHPLRLCHFFRIAWRPNPAQEFPKAIHDSILRLPPEAHIARTLQALPVAGPKVQAANQGRRRVQSAARKAQLVPHVTSSDQPGQPAKKGIAPLEHACVVPGAAAGVETWRWASSGLPAITASPFRRSSGSFGGQRAAGRRNRRAPFPHRLARSATP